MRRHVRYRPLAPTPPLDLAFGSPQRHQPATLIDESRHGCGLKVTHAEGLAVGQTVQVTIDGRDPSRMQVRRIVFAPGGYHLGLERLG